MRQWPSPLLDLLIQADTVNIQPVFSQWTSSIHRMNEDTDAPFAGLFWSHLHVRVVSYESSNVLDIPFKRLEGGVPGNNIHITLPSRQQRCPCSKRLLEHGMASYTPTRPGHCLGFMDQGHVRHYAVRLSLLGLSVQYIVTANIVHGECIKPLFGYPFELSFGILLATILGKLVQDVGKKSGPTDTDGQKVARGSKTRSI